jgi:peptidoglycan/xylan/chitin deacetylase (PgdA/CDA1 family)
LRLKWRRNFLNWLPKPACDLPGGCFHGMNVPVVIQKLFKSLTWRMSCKEPALFLTFDDGPVPEVTPQVLDILGSFQAKATFFCLGENVEKYPGTFEKILADGHAVGNHTYHHLNGWKTGVSEYKKDIDLCDDMLRRNSGGVLSSGEHPPLTRNLFRPPYGKIRPSQVSKLKSQYSIVMWDVLSRDFDSSISGEECFRNVSDHAGSGSIVVFHDSLKARERVLHALPKVLDYFSERKFSFHAIGKY